MRVRRLEYAREIAHGMMFHHFQGRGHPQVQGSISDESLEAVLRHIRIQRILSPTEWLDRLDHGRLDSQDLCLTFDDGLLSQFDVALPVLERYRLKAFWFVYSAVFEGQIDLGKLEIYRAFRCKFFPTIDNFYDLFFARVFDSVFVGEISRAITEERIQQMRSIFPFYSVNDVKFRLIRDHVLGRREYERLMDLIIQEQGVNLEELSRELWMSDAQLRYLADEGHMVGLHSYSHPTQLASLPYTEQREEYQKNYQHIRRACGRPPVAVAHPANSYSKESIEILEALEIRCGFRSNMTPPDSGGQCNPNRYEIAREDHANVIRVLGVSG